MQIHFLLKERLEGYVFNPHRPEGLSFTDSGTGVTIEIRAGGKEGDFGFGHRNLEIRARVSCDAIGRQTRFVDALLNEGVVLADETPITLPHNLYQEEVISSDGKIAKGYSPTSDFLPKDLEELCIAAGINLEKHIFRFVQLLRWHEKASGPVKVRERYDQRFGLYWRTTQEHYHSVPWPHQGILRSTLGGFGGITWSDEDQRVFSQLWGSESQQEPLGHQLLRDAENVSEYSDRSALLICYSALEIGVKQHISKCAPDAGWLAINAPAPPLYKMLRDYLPEIHGGKHDFEKWDQITAELKMITKFTEDRNRLAHRGESITGSLEDYLRITSDLLYAFDVFEGHTWAKTRVSRQFGNLLGWTAPVPQGNA